ncbi:MAG: hypothetical protein FWE49_06845 [Synergistaceae bacterium]|nr:hypothetical protein [Synergistaceae bacterium]
MSALSYLATRRSEIASEISGIESMRKGTLNAQYQQVKHKNGDVVQKGPYFVLTRKSAGGKTVSKSISAKDAPRVQAEVDNYKRFRDLSEEYVDVCEKLSILTDSDDEGKKN